MLITCRDEEIDSKISGGCACAGMLWLMVHLTCLEAIARTPVARDRELAVRVIGRRAAERSACIVAGCTAVTIGASLPARQVGCTD